MTKLCSVCGIENKDDAQFCRACGTGFVAVPAPAEASVEAGTENICGECGFRNKPGIRYCANCGMSLGGAGADSSGEAASAPPATDDPYAGLSPPPISYQTFATVGPYPPAPAPAPGYPPDFDDRRPADIPDPDAEIAIRQQEAYEAPPSFATSDPVKPNRMPLLVGFVVMALILAGIAAWAFLGSASPTPRSDLAASAPVFTPPPPASAAEPAIIIEAPPASAPAATSASEPTVSTAAPPATTPAGIGSPPTAAAPLPQVTDPVPVETADAEAKRQAVEKARKDRAEKAARDKADRDAKAKALTDSRDQTAATSRADQEALARRRAEEARTRPSVPAPAAALPAMPTQAKGVREICAGRGTIAEAVCQSRQCGNAEHANEAICRQLRDADERRRNFQN